ncbi:metal-dependent hydrolase [Gammaproteobacteria bacterium AB-CW1]|uniref:Metal-dependent hydrolase n=1 Tax=Natronospira elongata TaxID=3110268 RepID=A0AAP6JEK2_9GAMM|nr:metal-dependent hydrolase [Gammaproteobacteria bacterium AB-CW1]
MDPLTHALSGALGNHVLRPRRPGTRAFAPGERLLLGAMAALFPDVDWVLRLLADELTYLNLHRGITHSLLMWPLWALLLGYLLARFWPHERDWRDGFRIFLIGMGLHIAGDFITSYGTQLFAPLSSVPLAFPSTFIIDPWISLLLLLGLVAIWRPWPAWLPSVFFFACIGLVGLQGALKLNALEHARAEALEKGLPNARIHALPQPLSPLHWRLIIEGPELHYLAHLGFFRRSGGEVTGENPVAVHWQTFASVDSLRWERVSRFGEGEERAFVVEAWRRPEFGPYRHFAQLPYLHAVEHHDGDRCAIFSDLRFQLPGLPEPAFRYAMCQSPGGEWERRRIGWW